LRVPGWQRFLMISLATERQTAHSITHSITIAMKHAITLAAVLMFAMHATAEADAPTPKPLPRYDHIVIVIEENKDYEQITAAMPHDRPRPTSTILSSRKACFSLKSMVRSTTVRAIIFGSFRGVTKT